MKLRDLLRLLALSFVFWLIVLEVIIFCNSPTFTNLLELLQPPYKETVNSYEVGLRSEHWDDDRIARVLQAKVRVHCLVYMDRSDYKFGAQKARHIEKTWARRCPRLTIVNQRNATLLRAYRQIYVECHNELDWLLVVYLDSYVVVENLRHLLAQYSPSEKIYFSAEHAAYVYAHVGQVSTTDYIFSSEALEQLATRSCLRNDIFFKECLTRMRKGPSEWLLPFEVRAELIPYSLRDNFWLWPCSFRFVYHNQSWESCFGGAVLLPYCRAMQMYVLEFLLYHLRPYGHVNPLPELGSPDPLMNIASRPQDVELAKLMYRSVRIICLVLTWPMKYMSGARAVSETWGRHCNRVVYYGSSTVTTVSGLEIVGLNATDTRSKLWGKTKAAFRHAYRNYGHEADWFYKADDDTYAIMENMRKLLKPYSPDKPIYFGSPFKLGSTLYMSGGAGYVLSKKAAELLNLGAAEHCLPGDEGTEDYVMGQCLRQLDVQAGDSRDLLGRQRFFSLSLEHFLIPNRDEEGFWLQDYLYQTSGTGMECCSTYSISIHNVSPYEMHFLDTILYKRRPYGLLAGHPPRRKSKKNGLRKQQYNI
ncbi:glycoprotein-N-acetylgalactosamine 3-beta-galactosyltransferase 1 [Drosophila teissieri]|uniref:glycoprotein-N-acetylgalactosamine 3-beta-galactosyltransferase 1 n=1 Tax=Drosophila teissieri TaxID=7243 RepID=UPI001CBA0FD3|nr:glycoprotein-N-acetylgalactosamine 3-beta-galactosyltransferase 1 [Drosophila teissieri]